MSEIDWIDRIQKYIDRTGVKYASGSPYQMNLEELFALRGMDDFGSAICLAFDYGRAKGERSARAAQRKKQTVAGTGEAGDS